jgi:peptide/nickel transport system permease protein
MTTLADPSHSAPASGAWREPARRFLRQQPLGVAGLAVVLAMSFAALASDWIAPYGYLETHYDRIMQAPGAQHWLGTDGFGRDLYSRILRGARTALGVGLISSFVSR